MRNSDRLAAINKVIDQSKTRIIIERSTALAGVVNRIDKWPEIHQALAVLVGYTEDGIEIPGLVQQNPHSNYISELIREYLPDTTEFPAELFNSIQSQLDNFCQHIPVIMHTLEQMSAEPSGSSLTAEYRGVLSVDEFQRAVNDLTRIADLLKIKNEINGVWTDFGSTVFGFDIEPGFALAMFHAAMTGAEHIREFIAGMTPEMVKSCFRLIDMMLEQKGEGSLPENVITDENLEQAISQFAHGEVNIPIPTDATEEQINGLKLAIPMLSQMGAQGWKLTTSTPTIDGVQINNSLVVIGGPVNIQALPQPNEATDS